MKCYRQENGSKGYKENVLNLAQNVKKSFNSLPLNAKELLVIILRKNNISTPEACKDFKARRWAIRNWLVFLKRTNLLCSDVAIDDNNLELIIQDRDISNQVNYLNVEDEIDNKDECLE